MHDPVNAFCPQGQVSIAGTPDRSLSGLRFAAKDVFDIAGQVTGAGNPDWARTHEPAEHTAPVVETLLAAGAELAGKTISDELTFSMIGANFHYGTPINPAAPGRVPGGSSSGSASAVAAGLVDFAIGTDTAGSNRLPASFCGIYGIRPSHGALSSRGVVPLAPGFDTPGWFARDGSMMKRVGQVLVNSDAASRPDRLVVFRDAMLVLGRDDADRMEDAIKSLHPHFARVDGLLLSDDPLSPGGLEDWLGAFRTVQGYQIWQSHGAWIERVQPKFGPDVAARFKWASSIDQGSARTASEQCSRVRDYIQNVLEDGAILCLPSGPGPAPKAGLPSEAYDQTRQKGLLLVCAASIAGTPQISLPMCRADDGPLGLALMARRGGEAELLDLAEAVEIET